MSSQLPPGAPTVIGMARPDGGQCAVEFHYVAGGYSTQGDPPHPTKGYRLPMLVSEIRRTKAQGISRVEAPSYRTEEGFVLEPGDLLCTPCYRCEFARHHRYDPIAGPGTQEWKRRKP